MGSNGRRSLARLALALASVAMIAPLAAARPAQPPQVVAVRVWPAAGPAERAAGVAVGPGRVLTVAHPLESGGRVVVRGADGVARTASVLSADRGLDLVLLAVPGLAAARVRVGDAGDDVRILQRGEAVRARAARVRRAITARLVDQEGAPRRPTLELAAEVVSGDSGSPVLAPGGRLAGLVYARSTARPDTAYAVRGAGLRRLACGC